MAHKHGGNEDGRYSKENRFAGILREYLAKMNLTHVAAGRVLRISPRNLRYLLSGKSIPNGSTLALIEADVARGAGCALGDIRSAVAMDRADRGSSVTGAADYSNEQNRIARKARAQPEVSSRSRP